MVRPAVQQMHRPSGSQRRGARAAHRGTTTKRKHGVWPRGVPTPAPLLRPSAAPVGMHSRRQLAPAPAMHAADAPAPPREVACLGAACCPCASAAPRPSSAAGGAEPAAGRRPRGAPRRKWPSSRARACRCNNRSAPRGTRAAGGTVGARARGPAVALKIKSRECNTSPPRSSWHARRGRARGGGHALGSTHPPPHLPSCE